MRKRISSGWHQSQAQYNCRAVRRPWGAINQLLLVAGVATALPASAQQTWQFELNIQRPVTMPLYNKNGHPLWIQSTDVPDADLAVIPIPPSAYDGCHIWGVSADWAKGKLKVRPTSHVTMIGYPYGYHDKTNQLPIWKTGSVASEPDADFDGKPLIVVDISAFPGMSGAPAFAISYGTYETEDGAVTVGGARRFLGVYASMQMLEEKKYLEQLTNASAVGIKTKESLQLGHVWKAKLIIDTIDSVDIDKYVAEVAKHL